MFDTGRKIGKRLDGRAANQISIATVQLRVGLLDQRHPEFVGLLTIPRAPRLNGLLVERKVIIDHHVDPRTELPEPEMEQTRVAILPIERLIQRYDAFEDLLVQGDVRHGNDEPTVGQVALPWVTAMRGFDEESRRVRDVVRTTPDDVLLGLFVHEERLLRGKLSVDEERFPRETLALQSLVVLLEKRCEHRQLLREETRDDDEEEGSRSDEKS